MAFPGILTLSPENGLSSVTLQYQPSSLTLTTSSNTNNVRGIDNIITFISSKNNTDVNIAFTAYFTALSPVDSSSNKALLGIGIAAGVATSLTSIGAVQSILNIASSTLSLANGFVDLIGGTISRAKSQVATQSIDTNRATLTLSFLNDWLVESTPLTINWDIENEVFGKQKYIINKADVSVKRTQKASTIPGVSGITAGDVNTLEFEIQIQLIKMGTRVILT